MHVKKNLSGRIEFGFLINCQCEKGVAMMAISLVSGNQRNIFKLIVCSKNRIVYYLKQCLDEQRAGADKHDILGQW